MPTSSEEPARVKVWAAMADHFLDTETRPYIPLTALRCLEAGLTVDAARDVWRDEVSPAVAFNVWGVAGEWAGWDRTWLVDRVERRRRGWDHAPRAARWLRYRLSAPGMHGFWIAIERCMGILSSSPTLAERSRAAVDLGALARLYFDFNREPDLATDAADAGTRRRLEALFPDPFVTAMRPVCGEDERRDGDRRVRRALGRSARPGPARG